MPSKSKTIREQMFDARLDMPCFLLTWREGNFSLTRLAVWSERPTFGTSHVSELAVPTLKQNVTELIYSFKSGIKKMKHRTENAQHYPWRRQVEGYGYKTQ